MTPTVANGQPKKGSKTEPAVAGGQAFRAPTLRDAFGPSDHGSLLGASLMAAGGFAVLLAVLTFGPFLFTKAQPAANAAPTPAEKPESPPAAQAVAPAPKSPADNSPKAPAAGTSVAGKQPAKKDDILDKLGESGTKTAPAKVNPLDKKDDDILKDIK